MMTNQEKLAALRSRMQFYGYDLYLVPTDDDHQSEYVGEHYKAREFITGFTGSAGTALISADMAGLWTDGRYFLQAEEELKGSGVTLFKMNEPGVPDLETYISEHLPDGGVLGFDGRVVSVSEGLKLEDIVAAKGGTLKTGRDLIDEIWTDRPPISGDPAFALDLSCTGESTHGKLARIREAMKKAGATVHVLASLDDICWVTNLRGTDVAYSPLLLSFAMITLEDMTLYIDENKLSRKIRDSLDCDNIKIRPYDAIYEDIQKLGDDGKDEVILLDPARLNDRLYHSIPDRVKTLSRENPEVLMKARKNETEITNLKNAHIKDGVAVTRFMYWMKTETQKRTITELESAEKLDSLRKEQEGYMWQSFPPICASGEHGAIIHYEPTPESDIPVNPNGLFLADTGGNYREGSTDVTRTFALGNITDKMKADFTTVLKGNLGLARVRFPYGTTGYNLDVLAREPLWAAESDYNHGTGHGVGYLLCIHEGPCHFSRTAVPGETAVLETGMTISDEPGIYLEGEYGIRIENELLVVENAVIDGKQFLSFQPLTMAPIDLDAVLPEMLSEEDRAQLNEYHHLVYETISPHLDETEREWLRQYTRPV